MKRNKKNAQGAGTIRKRSDGRWEARFTIGFDPVNGKQKQKSIYGKTQKEVREKLAQVTVEIDEGTYIEPCQMTLEEWMTMWLAEYMGDKKWSTIKHYKAQVKAHILPALGHCPLSKCSQYTRRSAQVSSRGCAAGVHPPQSRRAGEPAPGREEDHQAADR